LTPLILQRYAAAERRLLPEGLNIKMVTARGPLAVASWLLGVTDLLIALKTEPEKGHHLLEMLTAMIVKWLHAQLDVLRAPEGILLLDDIMGMLSPKMFEEFVRPHYSRIFNEFDALVKVFPGNSVGGPEFVKAILGPCPWTRIMPTGVETTNESISGADFVIADIEDTCLDLLDRLERLQSLGLPGDRERRSQ
jgi:hypothetical protein